MLLLMMMFMLMLMVLCCCWWFECCCWWWWPFEIRGTAFPNKPVWIQEWNFARYCDGMFLTSKYGLHTKIRIGGPMETDGDYYLEAMTVLHLFSWLLIARNHLFNQIIMFSMKLNTLKKPQLNCKCMSSCLHCFNLYFISFICCNQDSPYSSWIFAECCPLQTCCVPGSDSWKAAQIWIWCVWYKGCIPFADPL